jgi:hypothetical protein
VIIFLSAVEVENDRQRWKIVFVALTIKLDRSVKQEIKKILTNFVVEYSMIEKIYNRVSLGDEILCLFQLTCLIVASKLSHMKTLIQINNNSVPKILN